MPDEKRKSYPQPLLPEVDYQLFDEDFFTPLVELELGILESCQFFLEELEGVLLDENMIQIPEAIIAHLCAYLGAILAVFKAEKSILLEPSVKDLLKQHAYFAFVKFDQYPIHASVSTQQEQQTNLAELKEESPGSIVVQTLRLGRIIMDMMARLAAHKETSVGHVDFSWQKQAELFCPQKEFFSFLIPLVNEQHHNWQDILNGKSINYAINQLTIQIAWLIGYFAHLDKQPLDAQSVDYWLSCMTLYMQDTDELLQAMRAQGRVLTSMAVDSDHQQDNPK